MKANATLQELLTPQKPTRLPQTSMDNPRLSQLPIHAGPKATVSSKTYVNMLATNLVAALHITGQDVTTARNQILSTADKMEDYLGNWESHVAHIGSLLGDFEELFIIGRGPSMSSVWTGALICKEAAKYAVEGMNAAGFRHGPLELALSGFVALILSGSTETSSLNRNLGTDIIKIGGRVLWVGKITDTKLPTILYPTTVDQMQRLVEILPLQLLTIALAERKDIHPSHFRVVGKVTASE